MADKPPSMQDFSELVTTWERQFNEFSNQVMGTDEFSRSINQWQKAQLEFQKNFSEAMAKQLANFNMPSRDDVITVSEQLREMDARLTRIEKMLSKASASPEGGAKKVGPKRTRKPPIKESGGGAA
ncbi:MAG: hypothetical protein JJ934_19110 [Pseudomonadales bacterium]|nr:hypothetical protein [Pseudomonadales bacterium]